MHRNRVISLPKLTQKLLIQASPNFTSIISSLGCSVNRTCTLWTVRAIILPVISKSFWFLTRCWLLKQKLFSSRTIRVLLYLQIVLFQQYLFYRKWKWSKSGSEYITEWHHLCGVARTGNISKVYLLEFKRYFDFFF